MRVPNEGVHLFPELSSCEVCGGLQERVEGRVVTSMCDQRFHTLLERIEALEAVVVSRGDAE